MQASLKIIALSLMIYSALLLSGCASTRIEFDRDKVFKKHPYQSVMPFTMAGGKNNIAGVNDKGQSRLAVDVAHGFNSSFSFSPGKKLFFTISYTHAYLNSNYTEWVEGPFTAISSYDNGNGSYEEDTTIYQKSQADVGHVLNQKYFDVGAGFYKKLNKSVSFELSNGLSYGKAGNTYNYSFANGKINTSFIEERKYIRIFSQPALVVNTKNIEAGLATKLALYNFLSQKFTYEFEPNLYDMQRFAATLEPSLHVGFGRKAWIIYADMGFGIGLSKTDVKWKNSNFNIGFNLRLGKPRCSVKG